MKQAIEILAPAGDCLSLKAAVCAGADAVYAGGERFGARAYAKNFSDEELLSAIDYVHLHGRKLYLTVNTLVKEREFAGLFDYLLPLYRQGLDAVIVQDIGVMDYIREQFPGLAIHASTQMTVTSEYSAKYLESKGVERIVPARELSLGEIKRIREAADLEIECFVHGALCYCYSGQCLLSSMIGGRSGNRGQCAQPCRLPYKAGTAGPMDLLSLKDLCTIRSIPDLAENGVTSFKIEGRMKQPGYVAAVTEMYRKYTDLYLREGREGYRVSENDLRKLERVYQRRGYCNGYYYRQNGKEMLSLERPRQESSPEDSWETECKEKINGYLKLSPGKHATLVLQHGCHRAEVSGAEVQRAERQPLSSQRAERQMRKTGNTGFEFDRLDIRSEGDVFLPIQALNELRRKGLAALETEMTRGYRREAPERLRLENEPEDEPEEASWKLTVSVETLEQMETAAVHPYVSRIYLEDALWKEINDRKRIRELAAEAKSRGKQVYFAMARIFREQAKTFYDRHLEGLADCFDGALVRNLESFLYLRERGTPLPAVTDSSVYQWNRRAKKWWQKMDIESATAPAELTSGELKDLGVRNMELIVYGYLPVMVSAGCVRKNIRECDRHPGFLSMEDRRHRKNMVKNECVYCYNIIYNSVPLMLLGQYLEVASLRPKGLRLQFAWEDAGRTREVLDLFAAAYLKREASAEPDTEYTKGHFKRGVK